MCVCVHRKRVSLASVALQTDRGGCRERTELAFAEVEGLAVFGASAACMNVSGLGLTGTHLASPAETLTGPKTHSGGAHRRLARSSSA